MGYENKTLISKVFIWLFVGLLITFVSGYFLAINEEIMLQVLTFGIIPIIIIELVIAFLMGLRIQKMQPLTVKILYFIYSITTGITFSAVFATYELSSLINIFLLSAIIFLALALFGYKTQRDLTKFSNILFISLIVIIIFSLLNTFIFTNDIINTIICSLGVFIFCGYIAYDVNKLKKLNSVLTTDKAAVYGAFQLYLDFINLFIRLLELFGKRKD